MYADASDTLFDVVAVHDLGRVKPVLKTGLVATEVALCNEETQKRWSVVVVFRQMSLFVPV